MWHRVSSRGWRRRASLSLPTRAKGIPLCHFVFQMSSCLLEKCMPANAVCAAAWSVCAVCQSVLLVDLFVRCVSLCCLSICLCGVSVCAACRSVCAVCHSVLLVDLFMRCHSVLLVDLFVRCVSLCCLSICLCGVSVCAACRSACSFCLMPFRQTRSECLVISSVNNYMSVQTLTASSQQFCIEEHLFMLHMAGLKFHGRSPSGYNKLHQLCRNLSCFVLVLKMFWELAFGCSVCSQYLLCSAEKGRGWWKCQIVADMYTVYETAMPVCSGCENSKLWLVCTQCTLFMRQPL